MSSSLQGYSIASYGDMIADRRIEPYVRALEAAIEPGAVVLDIGTGTGFFAVLACRFGAKKVYAIEPDDAIVVAHKTAIDNNCADRIEFIHALSTQIDLPERVDVIISDLRGVMPLFQHHIRAIADARTRFLAPNGIQIPQQDRIWATFVTDPRYYQSKFWSPWEDAPYDCVLTANRQFVTNTWHQHRIQPEQLAVAPQLWATLDYRTIASPNAKSTLTWTIDRAATIHGIGAWFDTDLYREIGFSNAPDRPECIYGNAFFPLSAPIDLVPGDLVALTLQANLVGDDYIWSWQTQVSTEAEPTQLKINFQQSNFFGVPLVPKTLHQQSDSYIPTLNESGEIDLTILNSIAANTSLGEIAAQIHRQFPHRFATTTKALSYVVPLSQKYG